MSSRLPGPPRSVLVAFLFLFALVLSCAEGREDDALYAQQVDVDSGSDVELDTADAAPGCILQSGNPVCDACVLARCEVECTVCSINQDCLDILDCVTTCPPTDIPCLDDCEAAFPNGLNDLTNLLGADTGCLPVKCEQECG